jgi:ABC-type cobalamin/Fe3+-siderophores transport system ATPase subunit
MLELQNVRYRYPGAVRDALAGVSLSVAAGQFHAVLGPNGSGKTTLVRIALGALTPPEGTAEIEGRPAHQWPRRELARWSVWCPSARTISSAACAKPPLGRHPHSPLGRERRRIMAVDRACACDAPLISLIGGVDAVGR